MIANLKELTVIDGTDVYDMLQEIGPGENGFINEGYVERERFQEFLTRQVNISQGINLRPDQVPHTMYWLYTDGKPVGYGKVRHYLNDSLKKIGGHIGYAIRPSQRGKGYGKLILKELLKMAREKGITEVLMTCMDDNLLSRKVIEANNGRLSTIQDEECYYWIKT